jgi:hypothetical protein
MREYALWVLLCEPKYALDGVTVMGAGNPIRKESFKLKALGIVEAIWGASDRYKGTPVVVVVEQIKLLR